MVSIIPFTQNINGLILTVQTLPPIFYVGIVFLFVLVVVAIAVVCRLTSCRSFLSNALSGTLKLLNTDTQPKDRGYVSIDNEDRRKSIPISIRRDSHKIIQENDRKNSYVKLARGRRSTIISLSKADECSGALKNPSRETSRRQTLLETNNNLFQGIDYKLGSIVGVIEYNKIEKIICATITEVLTVPYQDSDEEYNLYILLALHPGNYETIQTPMCLKAKKTIFKEENIFTNITENKLKYVALNMKLFSLHDVHGEMFAGEVDIPLKLLSESNEQVFIESYFSPDRYADKLYGLIFVTLHLNLTKEKLIVSIPKAENLKVMGSKELPNSYCIIKLISPESKSVIRKTSVKHRSSNPKWDEPVKLSISETTNLKGIILKIKVYHKTKNGKIPIGIIDFPSNRDSSTFAQWHMMIDDQGEYISEWHPLKSLNNNS